MSQNGSRSVARILLMATCNEPKCLRAIKQQRVAHPAQGGALGCVWGALKARRFWRGACGWSEVRSAVFSLSIAAEGSEFDDAVFPEPNWAAKPILEVLTRSACSGRNLQIDFAPKIGAEETGDLPNSRSGTKAQQEDGLSIFGPAMDDPPFRHPTEMPVGYPPAHNQRNLAWRVGESSHRCAPAATSTR